MHPLPQSTLRLVCVGLYPLYLLLYRHISIVVHSLLHLPYFNTYMLGLPSSATQRHPLSKEERAEAEKVLALEAGVGNNGADRAGQTLSADGAAGTHGVGEPINAVDFFRVFDGWVDSKYPGDRGSATKVKVAFRKVCPESNRTLQRLHSTRLSHRPSELAKWRCAHRQKD